MGLGVGLGRGVVYWLIVLVEVLIGAATYGDLYLGLGLSPDGLFD